MSETLEIADTVDEGLQSTSLSQSKPSYEYKFNVQMTCDGCSGAIERVLKRAKDVVEVKVSLEKQEVIVKTSRTYSDIEQVIAKTGKRINSGETLNSGETID